MPHNLASALSPLAGRESVDGAFSGYGLPVPLIEERMTVTVRGGLALVSRRQVFRNAEDRSIEATITFPVPVHATLCRLSAKIGDRILTATAHPRNAARREYEQAVDDGRTAVLHEELLRGVHMISVAHIPPGAEITVTHAWIAAVSPRGAGGGFLRIPTTIGDIYGDSPLTDADELTVSDRVVHRAEIEIDAGDAVARIAGSEIVGGMTAVILDKPVDIAFSGLSFGEAHGVSAEGRGVSVRVIPDVGGDHRIDAAVVVDRSGSMMGRAARGAGAQGDGLTKLNAVAYGLQMASRDLRQIDRTELWQFDNDVQRLSTARMPLVEAVERLGSPRGGTEIGKALTAVVAGSSAPDIILITDGLSHDIDVQALANSGRRFTVVLVGDDSFEANVGRLAAMTGGQIIVTRDALDAADGARSALASVRRPKPETGIQDWPLARATLHTGGATIEANWLEAPAYVSEFGQAVGAFAAAIALPRLMEAQATDVAARHGLVCHLTSLVLVDEAGEVQDGLPGQRKVPLMDMACAALSLSAGSTSPGRFFRESGYALHEDSECFSRSDRTGDEIRPELLTVAMLIDWASNPEALRRGDFSALPPELAEIVLDACNAPEVLALTSAHMSAIIIVIGLMARSVATENRAADRIARAVLAGLNEGQVVKAAAALRL